MMDDVVTVSKVGVVVGINDDPLMDETVRFPVLTSGLWRLVWTRILLAWTSVVEILPEN
jgi:hypothetical protein